MLTDTGIKSAKPGRTVMKLSDSGGLQLWVTPQGGKYWRMAYRVSGKQRVLAIGVYPATSLKAARSARDRAREALAAGHDPSQKKRLDRIAAEALSGNTFSALADEFLAKKMKEGKAETTIGKLRWMLDFAKPDLGPCPIASITPPQILAVLRKIERRGRLETATRLRSVIGQVFRYAIATGRAENDPTPSLRGALTAPITKPRAAIVQPVPFGGLLRAVESYDGSPEVVAALQLLALTFVRPGELRNAEWAEFDLDAAVWTIPAGRMKMRRPHRVPLAPQALDVLKGLHALTGKGKLLFPSVRSLHRCMSENTINAALRRMGYGKDEMTGHGFRSAASSMLNESGLWNPDAIERQLAHVDNDSVRRAYARADFWDERVKMMDWWADKCMSLKSSSIEG